MKKLFKEVCKGFLESYDEFELKIFYNMIQHLEKYHMPQMFEKDLVIRVGEYNAISEIKAGGAAMMQYSDSLKSLYVKYGEILQVLCQGRKEKGEEEGETKYEDKLIYLTGITGRLDGNLFPPAQVKNHAPIQDIPDEDEKHVHKKAKIETNNYKVMESLIKSWEEQNEDDLSLHSKTYIPIDEHKDLYIEDFISELNKKSLNNFSLLDHIIEENGGDYEDPKNLLVDMKHKIEALLKLKNAGDL
ncbi:uncharacterized protein PGTG_17198 [Puccinia graminis f. sp. tritici CRL 75-36-700-3]|uniref:Uncharacterized protein n=1 Tax=Puccinia graminis f. sp. tritici (strain CRL 75-36-700-3 / race SCCL) TaxID=418459 RepID=E3L301_PUCGT|nr:uncharacterized protein PGTG_17198 [Puccinia graminis f. sp. tritici CRL 75-36-700-3]EFP90926.2 hypothetical protein PGTG_17198 [Puccinia graminis f. sp. tritici CRL 75-36-700-3]